MEELEKTMNLLLAAEFCRESMIRHREDSLAWMEIYGIILTRQEQLIKSLQEQMSVISINSTEDLRKLRRLNEKLKEMLVKRGAA